MRTLIYQNSESRLKTQNLSNSVPKLLNSDIHVWSVNRSIYNDQNSYSEYHLNEYEKDRAQRFRFRRDHDLFVLGRYLTKILLAYYADCSPESVKIVLDSYGKPTCEMDLFFNISHSNNQLLIGFSNSVIGVDIERKKRAVNIERIGEGQFSEMEFQTLMHTEKTEKVDAFFEIWTKKESLIKGIGKGLRISLKDFNVTACDGKVQWNLQSKDMYGDWYVQKLEGKQGYKSAFATQNPIVNLSTFYLND